MKKSKQSKHKNNRQAKLMKQAKEITMPPTPIHPSRMGRLFREGLGIVLTTLAFYLLLALITHHSNDPSWSNTGQGVIKNSGGLFGAWLSDILILLFGYFAYLSPFAILWCAKSCFTTQQHLRQNHHYLNYSLKILGTILTILSSCSLINLIIPKLGHQLPMQAGGLIGTLTDQFLTKLFNRPGSELITLAVLLIGITVLTGVSWSDIITKLSGFISLGASYCLATFKKTFIATSKRVSQWTKQVGRLTQSLTPKIITRFDKKTQTATKPPIPISQPTRMPQQPQRQSQPQVRSLSPTSTACKTSTNIVIGQSKATYEELKTINNQTQSTSNQSALESIARLREKYQQILTPSLLDQPPKEQKASLSHDKLTTMAQQLEEHLSHFSVKAKVEGIEPGPVVTRFELSLAPGMKVSKVANLDKDLARAMSTSSVRIVEIIPGKPFIGIEIANEQRSFIQLSELLSSEQYQRSQSPLTLAIGKNISGHPVIMDLAKMPHLLVAGTTGSGKSVCLNTMLLSMLYKSTPKELRVILIDPKMLELSIYRNIPHLLTPVVTDMKDAATALKWCIHEMDRRYKLMAEQGVRNLAGLNKKIDQALKQGQPLLDNTAITTADQPPPQLLEPLPTIVVLIDELADLMMVVGKKIEGLIARIAQKARASGIHMILATQRPSVDVITGLIKANIPCRIAFYVSSRIDSRTILDQQGAHQLLGYGDMLLLPPGTNLPIRAHGPYVSDDEIHRVVSRLHSYAKPDYLDILKTEDDDLEMITGQDDKTNTNQGEQDPLYDQAVAIVLKTRRASISLVQRRLRIGYNRSANLLETMERAGIVSSMQSNGQREILVPKQD